MIKLRLCFSHYLLLVCCTSFFLLFSEQWTNWGHNQVCAPSKIWYPSNCQQVQSLIKEASLTTKQVRFVGSAHSWSDLVCTDGFLVNTDKLNRVLSIDHDTLRVTVEGGIKLKDLCEILAQEGLALSNQGFIKEQSIAGAIATATHGTGQVGTLSDFVVAVELIDAAGNMVHISETDHAEWLPVVRVHLGALGFIYSVTLQCEPLFVLNHKREIKPYCQIIPSYKKWHKTHDYFMLMLHPSQDIVLVCTWNRTHRPRTVNFLTNLPEDIILSYTVNYLGIGALCSFPSWGSTCVEKTLYALQKPEHREYSYITLSPLKCPITVTSYIEEEIAIPLDYFEHALQKVKDLYTAYEKNGTPLIGLITCRFGPALRLSYLNPAYGRETAYITVNILNYFPEYEQFFHDFEEIMAPFEGRPHWGKFHHLTSKDVYRLYGDNARIFNSVRNQLDPHGMFANNFIERCFNL